MGGAEMSFVLKSFSYLIWGALVMWMCAGFCMLESGSVRTKNASVICLKNFGLYAIAGIGYFTLGYNLMYVDVSGLIGSFQFFVGPSEAEVALMGCVDAACVEAAAPAVVESGQSEMSNWFFQMVFVATTASIVSGALAERVRLWPFFIFTALLVTLIYPIVGAWTWGEGGWLMKRGFSDIAGSTIVHSTGGWAALAGALVVGARTGKFGKDGTVRATPPSNIPIVTLGVFILWLGWFGFNGGSVLARGDAASAVTMSTVIVNTNLAAAAGVIASFFVSKPVLGRRDLFATLNGGIAGLVAITAGPTMTEPVWAIVIGGIGSVVCTLGIRLLDELKIDDVVGAIPAHLFGGIWGTLAAAIATGANLMVQLIGVVSVGAFVFIVSWVIWTVLDKMIGVRISMQAEDIGQDAVELGIDAYPEFVLMADSNLTEDH